jgi:hypothetical protein
MSANLYGIAEIAAALGARPPTVAQWHRRGRLPQPDEVLAMGPVWYAETVRPWIEGERIRIQQFGLEKSEARRRLEGIRHQGRQAGVAAIELLEGMAGIIVFIMILIIATSLARST